MTNHPENISFDIFMDRVNEVLLHQVDCQADDLPDYDYASAWEAGISSKVTAHEAIRNAGNF